IWLDSLDEALTRSIDGGAQDTVVALLRQFQRRWPPWVRFVATSRTDEKTRRQLGPLSGAKIEVDSEANQEDVRALVAR